MQLRVGDARTGTPKIEQYRSGNLIATYGSFANQASCTYVGDGTDWMNPAAPAASGCGPFTRVHAFRLWAPGDVFMVYPAQYTGDANQPWIGPLADGYAGYNAGIFSPPDDVTLQGVVQNNMRPVILLSGPASSNTLGQSPVYFDASNGFVMSDIDVVGGVGSSVGKAGVYNLAASNLTLRRMRVAGFERSNGGIGKRNGGNGVFGAGGYSGTWTLDGMELDHNGGANGPAHNAYIGASTVDPNFSVVFSNSYSHDAFYGHEFKSRAQQTTVLHAFLRGAAATPQMPQTETYLLDVPNGGILTVRNTIFSKTMSGPNSNGISLTFALEGIIDGRPQSIDIENNTFVAFAATYDGTSPLFPMGFFYPEQMPSGGSVGGVAARIFQNAFAGYCPSGNPVLDFRGDVSVTEALAEVSRSYGLATKMTPDEAAMAQAYPGYASVLSTSRYEQLDAPALLRETNEIGAED